MRLGSILFIGSLFLFSAVAVPAWVDNLPLCLFHFLTGWDCPGCGLTRAFIALFHGQLRQSISYNALAPGIALFLLLYAAGQVYRGLWKQEPTWFTTQGSRWIGALFLVLIFGQWIFKTGVRAWGML